MKNTQNRIHSGTNVLTDNWSFQVVADFISRRGDPSLDWGWIATNDKGVFRGTIKSGAFQIDSLISLLEQILFTNKIFLMKEWIPIWYKHSTDLNKLYNENNSGIINGIARAEFDISEEKELWLKDLLPNKKIKEKFTNGMIAFESGRNDFWSQILNGIAEYLSFSSIQNLTYSPHPARAGFLKSTIWSISNGLDYPTSGINRFNQIIDKKRISLSSRIGHANMLSKLNTKIPSAALLCIADSSDTCSPITVALQMRDNTEIKNLREILHNLTIAIGNMEIGISSSSGEVDFYVNAFEESILNTERIMSIPKSLGGNNKPGYIDLEYFNYKSFMNNKIAVVSDVSKHSGIITKLINTGSLHTRKILENKLKIRDPIVYEHLLKWHDTKFFQLLEENRNITLYKIVMEENNYINKGIAGIMGPDGKINNSDFQQNVINSDEDKINVKVLSEELKKLLMQLKEDATKPEHFSECSIVAEAKEAAENGDKGKALQALKKAGVWVFDTAVKIGIGLTAAVLKETLVK